MPAFGVGADINHSGLRRQLAENSHYFAMRGILRLFEFQMLGTIFIKLG